MALFDSLLTPCGNIEQAPRVLEKIDAGAGSEDEEAEEPLLEHNLPGRGSGYIQVLKSNAVDCERCSGPGIGGFTSRGQMHQALEALATPPVELVAILPPQHTPGAMIRMCGPHGRVEVQSPPHAQPGECIKYLLAPTPEYRVEVPPGIKSETVVQFRRPDGVEVVVPIPPGKKPGDRFEVTPPALMVQVPPCAVPGDSVIFRNSVGSGSKGPGTEETEWCRAQVPGGLRPGNYFAVRLPRPDEASSKMSRTPSIFELAMAAAAL